MEGAINGAPTKLAKRFRMNALGKQRMGIEPAHPNHVPYPNPVICV
ncbi:hypothetical protein SAMN05660900_02941, partial [Megasphaera cerevisiae DSM 20462]